MTRISAMVLTHNAEPYLQACLDSLRWVDEIVVMDDDSTDRTVEIARRYNAKIATRHLDTFSAQRNAALALCTGEWVLVVDADEWLEPELQQEIQQVLSRDVPECAFRMPRRNLFFGRWIRGCGWYPDYIQRLFRREGASYTGIVHEGLQLNGSTGKLKAALWHNSYDSLEHYLQKLNRYTTMAATEAFQAGRRAGIFDILTQPAFAFFKYFVLQKGCIDGIDGFLVSALSSFYVLMKYSKLYYLGKAR